MNLFCKFLVEPKNRFGEFMASVQITCGKGRGEKATLWTQQLFAWKQCLRFSCLHDLWPVVVRESLNTALISSACALQSAIMNPGVNASADSTQTRWISAKSACWEEKFFCFVTGVCHLKRRRPSEESAVLVLKLFRWLKRSRDAVKHKVCRSPLLRRGWP